MVTRTILSVSIIMAFNWPKHEFRAGLRNPVLYLGGRKFHHNKRQVNAAYTSDYFYCANKYSMACKGSATAMVEELEEGGVKHILM